LARQSPPTEEEALTDALALCYGHLARREHSMAELRARLERARVDEEAISRALEIVAEQGYLDDVRYARLLAADRRAIDGWGAERIRERLQHAGVERDVIDATLEAFDHSSERDAALELLRRRWPRPPESDPERQRAFGLLVRQGFESEVAYDAIREHERVVS